jgi:hypothetical protein
MHGNQGLLESNSGVGLQKSPPQSHGQRQSCFRNKESGEPSPCGLGLASVVSVDTGLNPPAWMEDASTRTCCVDLEGLSLCELLHPCLQLLCGLSEALNTEWQLLCPVSMSFDP